MTITKRTITVSLYETPLTLEGVFIPNNPGGRENPPSLAEFEIDKVYYEGKDITSVLDNIDALYSIWRIQAMKNVSNNNIWDFLEQEAISTILNE